MKPQCILQNGFAAITAVFLIVVLAALGGFMLTVSTTQQLTSAQDIQGSRAYWAAQGGLEWAMATVSASAPVAPALLPLPTCPLSAPPSSLDGFTLIITCSSQTYSEAANTVNIFRLTSVAYTGSDAVGSLGFVERSVSALIER